MDKKKSEQLKEDNSDFTKSENTQKWKEDSGRDRWLCGYFKNIKN